MWENLSENESLFFIDYEPFFRTGVWECVVASIGGPANLLVLFLALSLVAGRNSRSKKNYNQHYVCSMTLADFLFTAIHAPLYGLMYVWQLDYEVGVCRFLYVITHMSTVSSSLSLLCLNIDKFVAIHRPLHHSLIMNKRTTYGLLGSIWLISLSWAVLLSCGPLLEIRQSCGVTLKQPTAYYVFAVLFFVVPILLSFVIAIYVALVTDKTNAKTSSISSSNGHQRDEQKEKAILFQRHCSRSRTHYSTMQRYKFQARMMTFVFCTTIWSTLTSIPYRLSFILHIFNCSSIELSMFLFGLLAANALGNPFITLVTQRQYRKRLSKRLRQLKMR